MKDIWVSKCIELPVKVLTCWGVNLRVSITLFNLQVGKRSELPNTCQPRAPKCSMQVAMFQETLPSSPLALKAMTLACVSWVGHILLPAGPDTNINKWVKCNCQAMFQIGPHHVIFLNDKLVPQTQALVQVPTLKQTKSNIFADGEPLVLTE